VQPHLHVDGVAENRLLAGVSVAERARLHGYLHAIEPRGELYRLVMRYANSFLGIVARGAACNARHSAEQRLACWLLKAHDRVRRDRFHLTHNFISMMIGIRRPSVTEVMGTLRDAGAIEYAHGGIRIVDRAVLECRTCACYAAIRGETDDGALDSSLH
jgi:CRP-like cAMP-binding protein